MRDLFTEALEQFEATDFSVTSVTSKWGLVKWGQFHWGSSTTTSLFDQAIAVLEAQ